MARKRDKEPKLSKLTLQSLRSNPKGIFHLRKIFQVKKPLNPPKDILLVTFAAEKILERHSLSFYSFL